MTNKEPRVLVVEDSFLIATAMKSLVERCGCSVVGPVGNVRNALEAVRQTTLDGAILDINLADARVWPVAELLQQQGVPFLLASGYSAAEVPPRFREYRMLTKPISLVRLRDELVSLGLIDG